ncbi:response regulator [Pseudactinotalea sp.]|uniref:response regulator n=1 Tax=Pseudactinotalea sp. TaxID=1926260 RepID=UPI003B3B9DA0
MPSTVTATRRRVLVVDDHRVVADLLAGALDGAPDLECVGVAADGPEALERAALTRPDVVLLDVRLPSVDGLALLRSLRAAHSDLRVNMLTGHPRPDLEREALAAGASGFLAKDGRLAHVLDAVRTASPARPARDPGLTSRAATAREQLTRREHEVLSVLAEGVDVRGIAGRLGLSIHTTRDHVKAVLAKLEVRSQLGAVAAATRLGMVRAGGG